jgi:ATP-dependent protease HslVU (ClpYQ) peptidase subunit
MTTIVADTKGMASDSQMTDGGTKSNVPKFWRVKQWLIGGAGDYSAIIKLIEELKAHPDLSPAQVLTDVDIKMDKDAEADLLLLSPGGKLYHSENGGYPLPSSDKFAAIGSGSQGALVAMHLGCTPREAVAAVKKVDPSTGGRIITRKI